MTDEQALKLYEAMVEYFDCDLPSPDHEPKQFAYCVKLFKYYRSDVWAATLM